MDKSCKYNSYFQSLVDARKKFIGVCNYVDTSNLSLMSVNFLEIDVMGQIILFYI